MAIIFQRRYLLVVLCWSLIFAKFSYAQENIISFYPKAYAKTLNPPEEKKLMVIAEQKIEDKYVTFIGVEKSSKVLLATITKNKLRNPKKAFLLNPKEGVWGWDLMWDLVLRYAVDTFWLSVLESLNVSESAIDSLKKQDSVKWGYLYDRNSDGKIDFLALFNGPLPVEQQDFPSDYPKGGIVDMLKNYGSLTAEQIQILKKSWEFVFSYIADENFDGKADGVVIEVMDPERYWVDRWMVLLSSDFNGVVDSCWQFKDNIQTKDRGCLKLGNGFWARRAGVRKSSFGNEDLAKISELLTFLNKAASLCGLTKDSFYKE